MTNEQTPMVFTPEEAANLLRVHRDTLYKLLRTGVLRGKKAGAQWRITAENLRAYLEGDVSHNPGRTPPG